MGRATRTAGPAAPLLKSIISGFGDNRLRVGFFETAAYPDGTPVAYVAAIHEFGSGPIPPRPFMRPTAQKNKADWDRLMSQGAAAAARGDRTPEQVLEAIGGMASMQVSETIAEIHAPALSMTTLLARKYNAESGPDMPALTGKKIGELHRNANFIGPRAKDDTSLDVSGVSHKPLVDTGLLIQSPTYVVDRKGSE